MWDIKALLERHSMTQKNSEVDRKKLMMSPNFGCKSLLQKGLHSIHGFIYNFYPKELTPQTSTRVIRMDQDWKPLDFQPLITNHQPTNTNHHHHHHHHQIIIYHQSSVWISKSKYRFIPIFRPLQLVRWPWTFRIKVIGADVVTRQGGFARHIHRHHGWTGKPGMVEGRRNELPGNTPRK